MTITCKPNKSLLISMILTRVGSKNRISTGRKNDPYKGPHPKKTSFPYTDKLKFSIVVCRKVLPTWLNTGGWSSHS